MNRAINVTAFLCALRFAAGLGQAVQVIAADVCIYSGTSGGVATT